MENGSNVFNLFKTSTETRSFLANQDYPQIISKLARRIHNHYVHISINGLPIDLDHASLNESIILAIGNLFEKTKPEVMQNLQIAFIDLVNIEPIDIINPPLSVVINKI